MNEPEMDKLDIVLAYAMQFKIIGRRINFTASMITISMIIIALLSGCTAAPLTEPDPERAQAAAIVADARSAAEAGDYRYAVDRLMQVIETTSDPNQARQTAQLASAIDDWPAATVAARRWLALAPESRQAAQFATIAALRQQRVDRAVALLQTRLVGEGNPMAWTAATALLATAGSDEIASAALERLIEQAEDFDAGFDDYLRSRLAWQLDNPQRAFELAEQALRARPDHQRAVWAGRLARSQAGPEQALEYFGLAGRFDPDDRQAAIAEMELLRELGRSKAALEVLARLPEDAEILYARGVLEQDLGRIAAAGATWQRMASMAPEAAGARHAWLTGLLAEMLEMSDEAIAWYGRVDGAREHRADLRRANLLADRGELAQARSLLADVRQRPQLQPEITEQAWLVEGELLAESGDNEQALQLLSKALTQLPGSSALLYARAMSAVNQQQLALAEQDLRTIIQSDPENAVALNALGYTLSDRTDRQREALRLIETALALEPDNPAILDSMGWVLFKLGRADEALPYLRDAVSAEPHPEIVAHLIEALWALDRRDEAREWIARTQSNMAGETVYAAMLQRIGLD